MRKRPAAASAHSANAQKKPGSTSGSTDGTVPGPAASLTRNGVDFQECHAAFPVSALRDSETHYALSPAEHALQSTAEDRDDGDDYEAFER